MRRFVPVFCLVLPGAACSSDGSADTCPVGVRPCDITVESCRDQLIRRTACTSRYDDTARPSIEVMSSREFRLRLEEASVTPPDVRARDDLLAELLRQLRLLPAPGFVDPTQLEMATEQAIASGIAYYDANLASLTIIEDYQASDKEAIRRLAHETVLALQDDAFGLLEYRASHAQSLDASIAADSMVLGEARFVTERVMDPDSSAVMLLSELQRDEADLLEEAKADGDIGQLAQSFANTFGASWIARAHEETGEDGIAAALASPPVSTREVMNLGAAFQPAVVALPVAQLTLPEGFEVLAIDTMGALADVTSFGPDADRGATWVGDQALFAGNVATGEGLAWWKIARDPPTAEPAIYDGDVVLIPLDAPEDIFAAVGDADLDDWVDRCLAAEP